MLAELTDTSALDTEAATLTGECEVVTELIRKGVEVEEIGAKNAPGEHFSQHALACRAALAITDYNARRDALLARFKAAEARLAEINAERGQHRMKQSNITASCVSSKSRRPL